MSTVTDTEARSERSESSAFSWAAMFVAIVALLVAGGAFGFVAINHDDNGSSAAATASGPATKVEVTLADISMSPKEVTVDAGAVDFVVTNTGAVPHDFVLPSGERTAMLDPGQSETLRVASVTDGTEAYCSVPGHAAAGMTMMIHVKGAASGGSAPPTDDAANTSDAPTLDFAAAADDAFEARDPEAPVPDGVKN